MEGSFGGFFSGVVEERHDTPERVIKHTLFEAREARFFFFFFLFFNETGTFSSLQAVLVSSQILTYSLQEGKCNTDA